MWVRGVMVRRPEGIQGIGICLTSWSVSLGRGVRPAVVTWQGQRPTGSEPVLEASGSPFVECPAETAQTPNLQSPASPLYQLHSPKLSSQAVPQDRNRSPQ